MHGARRAAYHHGVPADSRRLSITLDRERAAKLTRLAERAHVHEGTLARSLLSSALDEADPDARHIVSLLDGVRRVRARRARAPAG